MRVSVQPQIKGPRRGVGRPGGPLAGSAGARQDPEGQPADAVGFGPHLVFDGYGCPRGSLEDLGRLYGLLEALPDRIGMTRIMPPYVFRHGPDGQPGSGVSGFALIAESHISVHTFPARHFVNADIFSCCAFDVEDALQTLRAAFFPRRVDWRLIDRGREFPKHIGGSRAAVMRERRVIARRLGLEVSR